MTKRDISNLPLEITLRAGVTQLDPADTYELGGVMVRGPDMVVEVLNMREEVLYRMPVGDVKDWIDDHHYRYVPRTQAAYHREPAHGVRLVTSERAPLLALPAR